MDALFIADYDMSSLMPAQLSALDSWVASGGRMVVAGGPGWQRSFPALDPLLPLEATADQTLPGLTALDTLLPGADDLVEQTVVTVGRLRPGAYVLAEEQDFPLLIARPHGRGQALVLTADPGLAPLSSWTGLPALFEILLGRTATRPPWSGGFQNAFLAENAVAELPGLDIPSTTLVCGFLTLYILAVGPANYLLLRRLKRRDLAWLSIPALVLAFSGVAYLVGNRSRGNVPILNQLAVIQSRSGSTMAQVDSVLGLFSPRRGMFDVTLAAGTLPYPLVEDTGLNGPDWSFLETPEGAVVSGLRVEIGGLASFGATGHAPAPPFEHNLAFSVDGRRLLLDGTIQNRSTLDLEEAVLLGPGGFVQLGDLRAGEDVSVNLPLDAAIPAANLNPGGFPQPSLYSPLEEILGPGYFGALADPELSRRAAFLEAIFNQFQGETNRGPGVYLVGWTDEAPLAATLPVRAELAALSMHVIQLEPTFMDAGTEISFPPATFEWRMMTPAMPGAAGPYNHSIPPLEEVQIEFRPWVPKHATGTERLSVLLEGYGATGPTGLSVSLWDFNESAWSPVAETVWGENPVPEPRRYVGRGLAVWLRVENPSSGGPVQVERMDVMLSLKP
jgi:hypothetical protein